MSVGAQLAASGPVREVSGSTTDTAAVPYRKEVPLPGYLEDGPC